MRKYDSVSSIEGVAASVSSAWVPEVLRAVYAATLEPECWHQIMVATAPVIGTDKVAFFQMDRLCPSESVTEAIGVTPECLQALRTRNIDEDFIWKALLPLRAGTVYRTTELLPLDVLRSGSLYEQIAVPAGLDYVLGVVLENTPAFFNVLCFMQQASDFSDAARDALGHLVPHLQAALKIGRRIAVGDAGRREALLSFDRARQPLVVLDRSGYALHSNQPATELLQAANGVSLRFGRFYFDDIALQGEFERMVRLAQMDSGSGVPPAPHLIRVHRSPGSAPLGLSIIPVQRSSDRALMPDGARCMVLIHNIASLSPLPLRRLAWLYGLTPAESRVCGSLYGLGSVDAVAQDLHLTRNTVRSHLKTVYVKFGVATQGQLLQRLANAAHLPDTLGQPAWPR